MTYLAAVRNECPVRREPHHDVVMITGYEEAVAIYNDSARFSSCTSVTGPFPGFPVPLEGDDVSELIEKHRGELPFNDQLPSLDPPVHTDHRALLSRMITPKRLKENEEFMWRLADRQYDEALAGDGCEFIADFGNPFAMLVIADLLGVPESDHDEFKDALLTSTGTIGSSGGDAMHHSPLEYLYGRFTDYITDRRENPRDDVLTGLASAVFPDGSTPPVIDVVCVAANLFAAGQETTVRLLSTAVMMIAEDPALQARLRADRGLISSFVEEALRVESPIRGDFRLSKVPVTIGGVDLPAGTTVMLNNAAANRDPRRFTDPDTFDVERSNARQHIAFGRGPHSCPGAPLARAEAKVSLNRLLDRTADIWINEDEHGPADNRRYRYLPTFILRGLTRLHIEFLVGVLLDNAVRRHHRDRHRRAAGPRPGHHRGTRRARHQGRDLRHQRPTRSTHRSPDCAREGAKVDGYIVDVSDRATVEAAVAQVRADLGPVLILVNNAGIEQFGKFSEITDEQWDRVMAVNLRGPFICTQVVLPDMLDAQWGRIVNISSSSAQGGQSHMAAYVSSKAGRDRIHQEPRT